MQGFPWYLELHNISFCTCIIKPPEKKVKKSKEKKSRFYLSATR